MKSKWNRSKLLVLRFIVVESGVDELEGLQLQLEAQPRHALEETPWHTNGARLSYELDVVSSVTPHTQVTFYFMDIDMD